MNLKLKLKHTLIYLLGAGALLMSAGALRAHPIDSWRPGPGWNRHLMIHCGSTGYAYRFCEIDVGRHGWVRLQRQLSNARCVRGRSWGWNRAGVWVDRGCEADFAIERRW